MLKVKKKNRVLRIPDEKYEEYKAMGYTIYDEAGEMLYTPADPAKRIEELEAENKALNSENAALRAKLEALRDSSTGEEEKTDSGEENRAATDDTSKGSRKRGK